MSMSVSALPGDWGSAAGATTSDEYQLHGVYHAELVDVSTAGVS